MRLKNTLQITFEIPDARNITDEEMTQLVTAFVDSLKTDRPVFVSWQYKVKSHIAKVLNRRAKNLESQD